MAASQLPLRILVVDDNKDSAYMLSQLLKVMHHEVKTVNDGICAMEAVQLFRPNLVLLDLEMPGMNGYDVCRAIRQTVNTNSIMVVAQTGWEINSSLHTTIVADFDDHLMKPIEMAELQGVLHEAQSRAAIN